MSARGVPRLRSVSVGEGTRTGEHRVLAGGASNREAPRPYSTGASSHDPLVLALAQLVRDRWAIGQSRADGPLALPRVPSNIANVGTEQSPHAERGA